MYILDRLIHHVFGIILETRLEGGRLGNDVGLISSRHIKPVESTALNEWLRERGKECRVKGDTHVLHLDNRW